MFDAIVHTDVRQVDCIYVGVACEQPRHVPWHEVAKRWREVVGAPDGFAHLLVRDVLSVARKEPFPFTSEKKRGY